MVMNRILTLAVATLAFISVSAQENQIRRIPQTQGKDINQVQYTTYERGFWMAADAWGGVSCHTQGHNLGFAEVSVTGGYRINEYLRAGVGIGGRYYINQGDLRRGSIKWGMPIFAAVRGNLMPGEYRDVVPFYSVEIGGSIRDGFMIRPAVGIRIGQPRRAFTISLAYMGQDLRAYDSDGKECTNFTNFVALRLGYEF